MQVSVESGEGLERKLKVQVPAEQVNSEVESRLKSMMGRVRIDGFRPGKVPFNIVKQRYGSQVFHEVAGEMIERSFRDALTQENLRPAGDPQFDSSQVEQGQPLEYVATFEVYPEVTLAPLGEIELEKVNAEITEADIDKMIETLRRQRTTWVGADRASEKGDRVTIDFVGRVDGEAFDGGTAQGVPVVIGSGSMIPGFEEQLSDLTIDNTRTFSVTFPEDYKAANLAGKEAEFEVTVKAVESPQMPEVDAEFAKSFGIAEGDVEKLRSDIRGNMERELNARIKSLMKNTVMDRLIEANPVDVPASIVKEEAETLRKQVSMTAPGTEQPVESYMEEATRRVKLGLILAELVKTAAIQLDPASVRERIEQMSRDYEDPAEFVRYYESNPQLMRGIETLVMEDKVVEWVASQARVSTVEKSFDDLVNLAT